MQTNNPNNYHWSETDISQFCESKLKEHLQEKGYTLSNMNISMQITNRMNKTGFLWDISMNMEKDGFTKRISEYDVYSENVDDDLEEIMEVIKKEAKENFTNDQKEEIKEQHENGLEFKRNTLASENTEVKKVSSKNINLKYSVNQESEDEFLDLFFSFKYFSQYAPFSTKKIIKLTDNIQFKDLDRENRRFTMKMDDCVTDNSVVQFKIEKVGTSSLKVEIKQDGIIREQNVICFWQEFIIPKLRMFFGLIIN